jgi:predicted unusual protein kinase regulating ubiquinone biosynthesis (AarF/ABC1/UbiB family)
MATGSGPSWISLASRAWILSTLIAEAAWIYALHSFAKRRWWNLRPEALESRFTRFAARFVRVATEFRGGLIKLGQVASLRVDVVPESITNELIKLQDRVPAHPYEEIALQVERELGSSPEELFREVDRTALAAASLGQVHRVVDRSGREVVIKVLYPGVERSVAIDLLMARLAMRLFNPLVLPDLLSVYTQISASIQGEMDYEEEGRAAQEVALNLSRDAELFAHLRVPRIDWETTSRRVLTMEYIDGDKINDRAALEARGLDVEECVAWATRAFLHMMFRDYFFHCDPHPGNLLVDREGRVAIIDFGMHQRIDTAVMDGIRSNVLAAVTKNEDLWVESLIQVGIIGERDRDVARYNLTPKELTELDFADYFSKMRGHLSHVGSFRLPDGMVSFGRAFSLLYGLALELAPGLRPLDVVGPYVLRFLQPGAGATPIDRPTLQTDIGEQRDVPALVR